MSTVSISSFMAASSWSWTSSVEPMTSMGSISSFAAAIFFANGVVGAPVASNCGPGSGSGDSGFLGAGAAGEFVYSFSLGRTGIPPSARNSLSVCSTTLVGSGAAVSASSKVSSDEETCSLGFERSLQTTTE